MGCKCNWCQQPCWLWGDGNKNHWGQAICNQDSGWYAKHPEAAPSVAQLWEWLTTFQWEQQDMYIHNIQILNLLTLDKSSFHESWSGYLLGSMTYQVSAKVQEWAWWRADICWASWSSPPDTSDGLWLGVCPWGGPGNSVGSIQYPVVQSCK